MVNNALNNAAKNDKSYRLGLPIGYQHFGGFCELDKPLPHSVQRQKFENQITQLIKNLKNHMDLDNAIDMFSLKNYYTNSLPPSFSNSKLTLIIFTVCYKISNTLYCKIVLYTFLYLFYS